MRVCLVGKYPPIEGGVSTTTYWLAHGLARKGHQVFVVTNAAEVESEYRMHLQADDWAHREPSFPESGGFVRVLDSERQSHRMAHIPAHNPFVSKLASMATQVIREQGCEVIFAYYYEPYGLAAHLASVWTGVPFMVRHAGSDLDRMMRVPQLSTAYKEALRRADAVCTYGRLAERFIGMGVDPERIYGADLYAPSPAVFNPEVEAIDVDLWPKRLEPANENGPLSFPKDKPTIGIYGKVGVFKGSFDLLHALARLRDEQRDFNLLVMTQGRQLEEFEQTLRSLKLDDRTWILPFQPNWRVPSFIKRCTAVCFLERDFPIVIHGPTVAAEILSAGGCLVLSREIADKQHYRDRIVHGQNLFVVEDPKDHQELAASLGAVIDDPQRAAAVGLAGRELMTAQLDAFDRYIDSWEQLLFKIAGLPSSATSFAERARRRRRETGGKIDRGILARALPWTLRLLGEGFEAEAAAFEDSVKDDDRLAWPPDIARAFLQHLERRHQAGQLAYDPLALEVCLRFEEERWRSRHDDDASRKVPPFPDIDQLGGAPVAAPRCRQMRPVASAHTRVVHFQLDPSPWLFPTSRNEMPAVLPARETIVLFHRTPNLMTTELTLSAATAQLLALCDGSRKTQKILDELLKDSAGEERQARETKILRALQTLYDQQLIIFCSPWSGSRVRANEEAPESRTGATSLEVVPVEF